MKKYKKTQAIYINSPQGTYAAGCKGKHEMLPINQEPV